MMTEVKNILFDIKKYIYKQSRYVCKAGPSGSIIQYMEGKEKTKYTLFSECIHLTWPIVNLMGLSRIGL